MTRYSWLLKGISNDDFSHHSTVVHIGTVHLKWASVGGTTNPSLWILWILNLLIKLCCKLFFQLLLFWTTLSSLCVFLSNSETCCGHETLNEPIFFMKKQNVSLSTSDTPPANVGLWDFHSVFIYNLHNVTIGVVPEQPENGLKWLSNSMNV